MFPRYLQYLLTDFRQTFVTGWSMEKSWKINAGKEEAPCIPLNEESCSRGHIFSIIDVLKRRCAMCSLRAASVLDMREINHKNMIYALMLH